MKKLIAILMISSLLVLTGCEVGNHLENMVVKDKEIVEIKGNFDKYIVTLEKDGQVAKLKMRESDFYLLVEGQIINVRYDESYYIYDIDFPALKNKEAKE